jgi:hypothetical protein
LYAFIISHTRASDKIRKQTIREVLIHRSDLSDKYAGLKDKGDMRKKGKRRNTEERVERDAETCEGLFQTTLRMKKRTE